MAVGDYFEEEKNKDTLRLRELLQELPPLCAEFFRGVSQTTSVKTRVGYAHDLRLFFQYLTFSHKAFAKMEMAALTLEDIKKVDSEDIEKFLEYVTYYETQTTNCHVDYLSNEEKGKARKLAAIRSLFKFLYKKKRISANPAALVDTPKIHIKAITRLDVDEVARLLDEIESGEKLTKHQQAFHQKTRLRDLALVTMFLGTGMRLSECVGINIEDIDFKQNGVKVTRKGGNQVILYFGEEVRQAVDTYLEERISNGSYGKEGALFLSSKGTRINVRTVQNLVKKYAGLVTSIKNISPHKLRSTYGTNLYQETGDIYLVADVLGHADVNTTKKHYAQIEEDRRRRAAKVIKLRKE